MWPVLCGYFLTACFCCCNRGHPHSYSTSPHQVCRFSFVACRDGHHLLFLIFERMDHLVADDACYIIHALFSDRLFVSSWCLGSSRSKCGIAFVCSDSAVRTVRARQCFTMVAGWWLMPVESLVLASTLYVFSNVMSLQTPLDWASVRRPMIFPSWMPLRCSSLLGSETGRIHTSSDQQIRIATYFLIQPGIPPIGLHAQHGCTASGSSPYPSTSAIALW